MESLLSTRIFPESVAAKSPSPIQLQSGNQYSQIMCSSAKMRKFPGYLGILLFSLFNSATVYGALILHGIGDGTITSTSLTGNTGDGEYATGYAYDWRIDAANLPPDDHLTMRVHSNIYNNQWLATNSVSPWDALVPDDGSDPGEGIQPTIHFADKIEAGDSFYFAQTFSHQLHEFSTGTRIANDLFNAGMTLHVGLRNNAGNQVLGSVLDGLDPSNTAPSEFEAYDPAKIQYGGYSQGFGVGSPTADALTKSGWTQTQADNYEWIKFEDVADPIPAESGTGDDDILLHLVSLKTDKDGNGTVSNLSEIVWFFDVPVDNPIILADDWEDRLGVNGAMAATATEAFDDVVFSWTVNAKGKDPKFTVNEDFESPSFPPPPDDGGTTTGGTTTGGTTTGGTTTGGTTTGGTTTGGTTTGGGGGGGVPEPSRVLLVLLGLGAMLCSRRRSAPS